MISKLGPQKCGHWGATVVIQNQLREMKHLPPKSHIEQLSTVLIKGFISKSAWGVTESGEEMHYYLMNIINLIDNTSQNPGRGGKREREVS